MLAPLLLTLGLAIKTAQPELVVQEGHSVLAHAMAVTPDDHWLVSGGADMSLKLWDLTTGLEARTLQRGAGIWSVAIPRSGDRVYSGDDKGVIRVHALPSGALLKECRGHQFDVRGIALSRDGSRMVSYGLENQIILWDAQKCEPLKRWNRNDDPNRGEVMSLDYSPVDDVFIVGRVATRQQGAVVEVWDARSFTVRATFPMGKAHLSAVALSPDGKRFAVGDVNGFAGVLDLATGKGTGAGTSVVGTVGSIAFSPDGRLLAVGAGSRDLVKIIDTTTGSVVRELKASAPVAFSPTGALLGAAVNGSTLSFWNWATGAVVTELRQRAQPLHGAVFQSDGRHVVSAQRSGSIQLWDFSTIGGLQVVNPKDAKVGLSFHRGFAVSPDGSLAAIGIGSTTELWDLKTGEQRRVIKGTESTENLGFSRDGRFVGVSDGVSSLRLYDVTTGELKREWLRRGFNFAFSDLEPWVVVVTPTQVVEVLNYETGASVKVIAPGNGDWMVRFAPGRRAVFFSDGTLKLHDLDKGKTVSFPTPKGATTFASALAVDPAGKRVAVAFSENARPGGQIAFYDLATGKLQRAFPAHDNEINTLSWSPDGRVLLSASYDTTMQFRSGTTGELLVTAVPIAERDYVMVTPEGYYALSRGGGQGVAFRAGSDVYPFEQFDLQLNRPDIVLGRLGMASKPLIDAYRQAYARRLKRMHFTEEMLKPGVPIPRVQVTAPAGMTKVRALAFDVRAMDAQSTIDRLRVDVNGVPAFGSGGIDVRDRKSKDVTIPVQLNLSQGRNKIQVSALNAAGLESYRRTFEVFYDGPARKPDLYVVALGVSDYDNDTYDLQYAAKDARDIAQLFQTRAKGFGAVKVRTLLDQEVTREQVRALKGVFSESQEDDEVVLFVAGHGIVDENADYFFGTKDIDLEKPSLRGLQYDELEDLVDGIRARHKLLLVDTCNAGEVDKDQISPVPTASVEGARVVATAAPGARGVKRNKPLGLSNTVDLVNVLFADLRRGSGASVLVSSGGTEQAIESAELKNGAFTWSLLSGVRNGKADANKDRAFTIAELRDYLITTVPQLKLGNQTPSMRRENFEFDFAVFGQ